MITKARTKKHAKSHKKPKFRGAEWRSSERTKFVAAATLFTELTPHPGDGHKVWVSNISLGGLAFKTRRVYEVGDSYHIRLDAGPIEMNAPIRILWTHTQADGIFEVGCEFVPD